MKAAYREKKREKKRGWCR